MQLASPQFLPQPRGSPQKPIFVVGRSMFSLWRRFSSRSSNQSLASNILSNQGLLLLWKIFPLFQVPKLIGINCFWPQINFSPFFSANYLWSQIIVHIFEEVPFCDSSASVLFNILQKLDLLRAPQNVNPLCWRQLRLFIMHRMKGVKSFQPPHGFDFSTFLVLMGRFGWYTCEGNRFKSLRFVFEAIS